MNKGNTDKLGPVIYKILHERETQFELFGQSDRMARMKILINVKLHSDSSSPNSLP